ncbi:hypothetical protein Acid345_0215 [Candidatus Koribacter versatilis Ellin345]|uniref:Uncharacterized protein n=1 Tax=Koribacter versatilis (strain Ellin345) TaxID=204669 RepID=Q1IV80_KORVE|nr:hypothetical protein Acid345_0215 [Candidatus Koribacter versatilis Ellin345]
MQLYVYIRHVMLNLNGHIFKMRLAPRMKRPPKTCGFLWAKQAHIQLSVVVFVFVSAYGPPTRSNSKRESWNCTRSNAEFLNRIA